MDAIQIVCPNCQESLTVPDEIARATCTQCRQLIDVLGHVAFEWGQQVFVDARHQTHDRGLVQRGKRAPWVALDPDVALSYQQAYGAIREAFRTDLHETQRKAGIEIMAEITSLFSIHMMTSPLEANYWSKLLAEQAGLDHYWELEKQLQGPMPALLRPFLRAWRRARLKRLARTLLKVEKQVDTLEEIIDFVERPRARSPKQSRI